MNKEALVAKVNIIGAGLSGLSAAITLARAGTGCNLISTMPSERAQSVLAEGGINAALDTMGEGDSTGDHFADTMKGGCYIESESAVRNLTENAPEIVRELVKLGVPFRSEGGRLILRNFGGQSKKRTAYAKSSTGKMIMTALIDECRKYEASGLIARYPHHELTDVRIADKRLISITIIDKNTLETTDLGGPTIICTGGLNGFFEGLTTGTTQNTGNAAALLFSRGVEFSNLEFIQYHPTTIEISNKRMLISEAARGEGGRLWVMRDGEKYYFMEDRYPELGNLMPRDVVSREMEKVLGDKNLGDNIYLDLTGLDESAWSDKLTDLREEVKSYIHIDPAEVPVEVKPGIHFFMGGIHVNENHGTNIEGLYAAGEAASIYHGANRLGGNSMLAAIYGGEVAAASALRSDYREYQGDLPHTEAVSERDSKPENRKKLRDILTSSMGITRDGESMSRAETEVCGMMNDSNLPVTDLVRARMALAMLRSALARAESRGAHYRSDYPESSDEYRTRSIASFDGTDVIISFENRGGDI